MNTTNFGGDDLIDAPTPIIEGDASSRSPRIAAYVCKQRKLNYLKLHIQSTNRKRFSPAAVDNNIRDFVNCPKILLHATHSQIPTTHFVSIRHILGLEYTENLQLLEDFVPHTLYWRSAHGPRWNSHTPDPLPRLPNVRHKWHKIAATVYIYIMLYEIPVGWHHRLAAAFNSYKLLAVTR